MTMLNVQNVVPLRKMFESPLVGKATRLLEKERKLTLWPSPLMEGMRLLPFDEGGALPPGTLATAMPGAHVVVVPRHVCRTNMFSIPFAVFAPRFEDRDAKATVAPMLSVLTLLRLGCSLMALPGVVPSAVETSVVDGVHAVVVALRQVSRTYSCWTPPDTTPRFVPVDAKITNRPSSEMTDSELAPFAGVTPSGVEPICACPTQAPPL